MGGVSKEEFLKDIAARATGNLVMGGVAHTVEEAKLILAQALLDTEQGAGPKTATEAVAAALPEALAEHQAKKEIEAAIATSGRFGNKVPLTVHDALYNVARVASTFLRNWYKAPMKRVLFQYVKALEKTLEDLDAAEIRMMEALSKTEYEEPEELQP